MVPHLAVGVVGLSLVAAFLAGCTQEPSSVPGAVEAREPGRLEAKLAVRLGEHYFADANGTQGGPFRVPSGKTVGLHFTNTGASEHEVALGRDVTSEGNVTTGYATAALEGLAADVFVYQPAKVEVETGGGVEEIEVEPGGDFWVRVIFPAEFQGEWELGCFIPGHYEQGMHARFVIA